MKGMKGKGMKGTGGTGAHLAPGKRTGRPTQKYSQNNTGKKKKGM